MNRHHGMSRRGVMASLAGFAAFGEGPARKPAKRVFRPWTLAAFSADVTPPLGHPCMGGGVAPARTVVDRLDAIGFVLGGGTLARPVVLVSVDWCEIRNDAYGRWREVLAESAGTVPEQVFLSAVHQHDAPIADLAAQRLLEENHCVGSICHLGFHELAVQRVARALRASLRQPPRRVTHLGIGQAKVEKIASNRRYSLKDGTVSFSRASESRDPQAHEAPEGTIDPWLKTLSFWDGEKPLLALSHYAVHPMSYYGQGGVSADFVGMARRARQKALPDVTQIYVSGCSGNVTAGKYNDGSPETRPVLAARLEKAMTEAWAATRRSPLEAATFRLLPLWFEPRNDPGFGKEDLTRRLTDDPVPFGQCLAAMGLSWLARVAAGQPVDLPVLDLGRSVLLLLPGESYIEYQLLAQKLRPDAFVMALGYGEAATGYIPTARHIAERDTNLGDWCWVAPSAERILTAGLEKVLKA